MRVPRLTSWWSALALLAAIRVAIPLAALVADGSKLPGIPRFTRDAAQGGLTGDATGFYAATLMERGHQVTISGGGAIHAHGLKPYLECDGCLLLGDEPDLVEIADYMEASGKKVWRQLAEVPAG